MDEVFAASYSLVSVFFSLAFTVVILVGMWKVYVKAGKPGWACIVPFYNSYCLFDMTFGNGWLFLLTFVPCVNFVMMILVYVKLAKAFGKGGGYAVGLIFLPVIFIPMLGFGDAQYLGCLLYTSPSPRDRTRSRMPSSA